MSGPEISNKHLQNIKLRKGLKPTKKLSQKDMDYVLTPSGTLDVSFTDGQ